jgi:hypothetical protein
LAHGLQLLKKKEKTMTNLEREKYLLALNDAQRLALLFALSKNLWRSETISLERFEEILTAYHIKE